MSFLLHSKRAYIATQESPYCDSKEPISQRNIGSFVWCKEKCYSSFWFGNSSFWFTKSGIFHCFTRVRRPRAPRATPLLVDFFYALHAVPRVMALALGAHGFSLRKIMTLPIILSILDWQNVGYSPKTKSKTWFCLVFLLINEWSPDLTFCKEYGYCKANRPHLVTL